MRLAWRACSKTARVEAAGAFPAAISPHSLTVCATNAPAVRASDSASLCKSASTVSSTVTQAPATNSEIASAMSASRKIEDRSLATASIARSPSANRAYSLTASSQQFDATAGPFANVVIARLIILAAVGRTNVKYDSDHCNLRLMKSNHAAYRASTLQGGEAFVDRGKPDALRDELVQHQAPVEIGARQ